MPMPPVVAMIWPVSPTTVALLLLGGGLLVAGRERLRGTTLMAVWWWGLAALISVAGVEIWAFAYGGAPLPAWADHICYAAAATTFCPVMAQLGAKRPQDRAWQFIVLSLWIVVVLPAGEMLLDAPGDALQLHAARRWFLALLIGLGLVNSLPTRYWPSGVLYALGQSLLLARHLPWPALLDESLRPLAGLSCGVFALALWTMELPWANRSGSTVDRWWLDFRDAYGTLWSLRLAERFNAAAAMYDWPVRMGWQGLKLDSQVAAYAQLPSDQRASIEQVLSTMLRRFVSEDWMARRRSGS